MRLLDYMSERADALRSIDDERWDEFIDATEATIRHELNLNRGRMRLPDDWHGVKDWLDGAPIDVLCDIDVDEGGVFYYYLCRIGIMT